MAEISLIKHCPPSNRKNFCGKIAGPQKIDSDRTKLTIAKQTTENSRDDSAEDRPPQKPLIKKRALELSYELKKSNLSLDPVFALSGSPSGRSFAGTSQSSPYDYVVFDYDPEKNQILCSPTQLYKFTANFPSEKLRNAPKTGEKGRKSAKNPVKPLKSSKITEKRFEDFVGRHKALAADNADGRRQPDSEFLFSQAMDDLVSCKQSGRDADELEQVGEIGGEAASDDEEVAPEDEFVPAKPFPGYGSDDEDGDFAAAAGGAGGESGEGAKKAKSVKRLAGLLSKEEEPAAGRGSAKKEELLSDWSESDSERSERLSALEEKVVRVMQRKGRFSPIELTRAFEAERQNEKRKRELMAAIMKVAVMKSVGGGKKFFELRKEFKA